MVMTADFDLTDPYDVYFYMTLMFDCHDCKNLFIFEGRDGPDGTWQWFRDGGHAGRKAGWYVAPCLPDGSYPMICYCPECAKKKGKRVSEIATQTI
jgi:hypothetical protein